MQVKKAAPISAPSPISSAPSSNPQSLVVPTVFPSSNSAGASLNNVSKNQLTAQMLKAKLRGDTTTYEKLQQELDAIHAHEREEVIVPFDVNGKPLLLGATAGGDSSAISVNRKGLYETVDKAGARVRYFREDDNTDLQTLVRQQRLAAAGTTLDEEDNYDANYAKSIIKAGNYKVSSLLSLEVMHSFQYVIHLMFCGEQNESLDIQFDEMDVNKWEHSSKKKRKTNKQLQQQEDRQRQKAIRGIESIYSSAVLILHNSARAGPTSVKFMLVLL
jgi:hypothetical protein